MKDHCLWRQTEQTMGEWAICEFYRFLDSFDVYNATIAKERLHTLVIWLHTNRNRNRKTGWRQKHGYMAELYNTLFLLLLLLRYAVFTISYDK